MECYVSKIEKTKKIKIAIWKFNKKSTTKIDQKKIIF